ncbi:MAG TPA: FKBP-type peptidyl-prolyl cis-trans isomerase [Polyangiaceae bacterium]|nr:FKBP-type peptidyl-prolyl cis-trans isomerase [Polyangiaceae bacterium]
MRTPTIAMVWLLGVVSAAGGACSKAPDEPTSDYKPAQGTPLPPGPTKLEIEDLAVGTGREAKSGDTVHVQYTGTLTNGRKFDSSYDHGGEPFKFSIGQGEVIKGWDQGVVGMKVRGKRRLRIPSDLGYGDKGSPPSIPPGAGLLFEVELVSID